MNGQQVVDRIGFAERWLDRAKRQCESGDLPRGMLTLVLANAEMTHALRMAGGSRPSPRLWWVFGVAFAAACSMALVALAGLQAVRTVPVSSAEVPIIVTFRHQPGALLGLIDAVPHQGRATGFEKAVPRTSPARIGSAVSPDRRLYKAQRSRPAIAPGTAFRAVSVSNSMVSAQPPQIVVTTAPSDQTAAEPVPSHVELINLILTAERTLRTPSRP